MAASMAFSALSLSFGCGERQGEMAPVAPTAPADASAAEAHAPALLAASSYCETVVDAFCAFYMRCGRMVARDEAECRSVFLQTCNARYEPRYVDLEGAALLTLSRSGVDACAKHLATVECVKQPLDLGGPCGSMWTGASPVGAPCGVDVESFVCGAGATCTLGLDFCGTCERAAGRGEPCGSGVRCNPDDACVAGRCEPRALVSEPCDATRVCVTGASCTTGTCVAPAIVAEGESCDAAHRCAYRSVCEAARCVRQALLGEPCGNDRACASGRCVADKCTALKEAGEPCVAPGECASASCAKGKCASLPTACFSR